MIVQEATSDPKWVAFKATLQGVEYEQRWTMLRYYVGPRPSPEKLVQACSYLKSLRAAYKSHPFLKERCELIQAWMRARNIAYEEKRVRGTKNGS